MDLSNISGFFYNIVPGVLFLIAFELSKPGTASSTIKIVSSNDPVTQSVIYIVIALFLGFIFQSITKLLRELVFNWLCFKIVIFLNKSEFDIACRILKKVKLLKDKDGKISNKQVFYLMDNYLRGESKAFNPIHFSSRFAFWSNIFIAFLIYFILVHTFHMPFINLPHNPNGQHFVNKIFPYLFGLSFLISGFYFYAYYDVVLKTFITITTVKNNNTPNSRNTKIIKSLS